MAYAADHQSTFEGVQTGYTYRVSIENEGGAGAASFEFAGTGHTRVSWNPLDGADELGPLMISEAWTRIHDPNLAVMADIGSATRLKIEQNKNDGAGFATYWVGETTALTKRSADKYASEIEIHATDGLGRLKTIDYQDVFANSGRISMAEAIHKILSQLGYGFSVAMASNWYSYRDGAQLTAADNPLEDRTMFNPLFYTDTARLPRLLRRELNLIEFDGTWSLYDVLQQVLMDEGLTLYQRPGGIWDVIQREQVANGSYGVWTYPSVWGAATKTTRNTDHTVSEQYLIRNEGGEWDKTEAYRQASIAYEHWKIGDEILDNPTFLGTGSVADHWTKVGTAGTSRGTKRYEGRETQDIQAAENTQGGKWAFPRASLNDSERVIETTGSEIVAGSGPLTLTFHVYAPNLYVPIELKVGSYWIKEDGAGGYTTDNSGVATDHIIVGIMHDEPVWKEFSITLDSVPETGEVYVALWQPVVRDPSGIYTFVGASFGAIDVDYAEDGDSDKDRTITIGTGSADAQGTRQSRILYLGSGPIASTPGSILDGIGGIAKGFDRGPAH